MRSKVIARRASSQLGTRRTQSNTYGFSGGSAATLG